MFDVAGPVAPGGVAEFAAQDAIESPVIQPGGVVAAVGFEGGPFFGGVMVDEVAGGFFEEGEFLGEDGFVVDVAAGSRQAGEAIALDPVAAGEILERDEQGIAGEGGQRRVRRVAVAGGAEGKNLPEALLRCGEEVGERIGGGPEIADATQRRQRSNVQQESRRALKGHEENLSGIVCNEKTRRFGKIRIERALLPLMIQQSRFR